MAGGGRVEVEMRYWTVTGGGGGDWGGGVAGRNDFLFWSWDTGRGIRGTGRIEGQHGGVGGRNRR